MIKFDEIVILGLEKYPERYLEVEVQLYELQLKYKVFFSYDKDQILNQSFNQLNIVPFDCFKNLTPPRRNIKLGALCCTLGHLSIIKYAQMNNLDGILIIEDDTVLSKDFKEKLKHLEEVPEDADIVYLGSGTSSNKLPKKYKITEHVYNAQRMNLYCTHCILITKKGYTRIVNKVLEFEDTIDGMLRLGVKNKELIGYTIVPHLAYQKDGISLTRLKTKKSVNQAWTKTLFSDDDIISNIQINTK